MFIHFLLAYFLGHFIGCLTGEAENIIPLDSTVMSEAILNPKKGLFIPQLFLLGEKLCNDLLQQALLYIKQSGDSSFLDTVNKCNQTIIETKGYLNFQDENTIDTLCSEPKMRIWDACGGHISLGINKCFEQKYSQSPSKGYNNWKFTKSFSQTFCNQPRYFKDRLLDGDNLVCSDTNKTEQIHDCNNKVFEWYQKMDSLTDLNDFCTNFGIMEHCVNLVFSGECHYAATVSKLLDVLKKDLDCDYFTVNRNATIDIKIKTEFSSKTSLLRPSFVIIALFTSIAFRRVIDIFA